MEDSIFFQSKFVLTGREQQILEFVSDGWSAKQIARRIDIAPRTVERHIENIRLKMQARNTAHMICCAFASGILKIADRPAQRGLDNLLTIMDVSPESGSLLARSQTG
jgi:DNA-binding CsgD family transcriptional regulator